MSARSPSVASHQSAMARRGTTKACPGLTGKRSAMAKRKRSLQAIRKLGSPGMAIHRRALLIPISVYG
jgi:hypothetical protein